MNTMPAIRPVGYSQEAVLYGYQGMQVVDEGTIGRLLYPEAKYPTRQVLRVYSRNKQHFKERDTVLLKVDTDYFWSPNRGDMSGHIDYACHTPNRGDIQGRYVPACPTQKASIRRQKVRFFSLPYGVMKICKVSDSSFAFNVLERMIEMHEAFIKGVLPRWDRSIATIAQIPKWQRGRGKIISEVASESGVSTITIRRHAERLAKGEPISKNCHRMKQFCHKKYRDIKPEVIRLASEGIKAKDITKRLGVPLKTVFRWR